MLSHVRRLFWSSPTFQSAIFFPNLDMLSRRKLWWTRPYTLLHALLCADFFQWRKRLLLKLRAADRNFADLKAHANLCTSAIWPVMQEYKSQMAGQKLVAGPAILMMMRSVLMFMRRRDFYRSRLPLQHPHIPWLLG